MVNPNRPAKEWRIFWLGIKYSKGMGIPIHKNAPKKIAVISGMNVLPTMINE
jgi:hypothetical protein